MKHEMKFSLLSNGSYRINYGEQDFGELMLYQNGEYVWCPPDFKGTFIQRDFLEIIVEKIKYLREYFNEEIEEYLKSIENSNYFDHFEDLRMKILYNPNKTLHEL